ncbi:hypothetical protein ALT_8278 [Aspergillus lentulus]|uniref:Uncharacterized protein n=1 Tax=Aspergillus lentulus TaxID=293939 RepID=A0AAN6BKU0_ASPLE|nr:uncharacterized protein IFM58399_06357 [Aspergillus lentulus]KAF4151711.1 hypothetical protein CNMCM6069_003225 [Aspergillus lentulus]KAF4165061.1 hypothetical protein CNMCM6936_008323 [Aspergillus lentulus]KAF4171222.1 hypothetical protein CNMCM8060_003484 [Aspergillus lentulus]KAF4183306.1 hypothetical protein CNMCM7927_009067 [Aspergillus lentulus]KAF4194089.1 hypothetical protein CNMCM8694_007962 [Aspergillus lentulus]
MDSDEAPPPYSAVDPLLAPTVNNRNNNGSAETARTFLRLRGGEASLSDIASRDGSTASVDGSSAASLALPANFASATAYFIERPPTNFSEERPTLSHLLTIYPRSQSKDFPRRPRCWSPRTAEITQQDWDMFLKYLFPPHLGLAASSAHLPRQLRAEIQRDRKDRPQETDEQRRLRIAAVIEEWNECFFEPRASRIEFIYVTESENAPVSPLCPRCYPAATRATRANRSTQAQEAGGNSSSVPAGMLPTVAGQQTAPPASGAYAPGIFPYPTPQMPPAPYPPYGPPVFFPGMVPNTPPPPPATHAYPYPPQPPSQYQQPPSWGWNNPPYGPQYQYSSTSKGGPLGWLSSLASHAQKYSERITEQAQHYGRQVEEQAMAHGRWIEEKAGLNSRKLEDVFGGLSSPPRVEYPTNNPQAQGFYAHGYGYPPVNVVSTQPVTPPITQATQPAQPARRTSVGSISSESSFSSIDSISTTSDLSSTDLATVRAQLQSLNNHHDRELYEAAVGLRRQLDVLRDSRRQSRISGRGNWRNGQQGHCRGSWGRWESPQEQQRSSAERRALKEEVRATKKAFKDVFRRAKDEQRERRRIKRNRWRQERRLRQTSRENEHPLETPLEQQLQNLELSNSQESGTMVRTGASHASPRRSMSSEASGISSINTPGTGSDSGSPREGVNPAHTEESKEQKQGESLRGTNNFPPKKDKGAGSNDAS